MKKPGSKSGQDSDIYCPKMLDLFRELYGEQYGKKVIRETRLNSKHIQYGR